MSTPYRNYFGAEDDGWVKSTASERISGYPSFLRKKLFQFEKQFTMPPYPNTLKIDVDGYFTGISYEDEDESYFNTPEFIEERKEFVENYTDERLHKILEDYTMSKVKNYYEEIADDNYFGEREEEEEEDISDWGLTDEEIAEYKQEVAEEKAQKMADLEEEMNSHIEYCDDYFKRQMNDYMSDWSYSWMGEQTDGEGHFMGHIYPTFLPTHIKFVDETRGITLYEYNNKGKRRWYDAESFESTPYRNYFGACLSPEGDCFETSLETCRAIGGRFQGPGTSCGGYQSPVIMRSETTETKGKGNGVWLAITVGVMTGVATTIFGNVLSEMWLDRLREDPELHTTPDDPEELV